MLKCMLIPIYWFSDSLVQRQHDRLYNDVLASEQITVSLKATLSWLQAFVHAHCSYMLQVKPLSLQEKDRLKQLSVQQQRELEAKKARKQDFQAGRLLLGFWHAALT